MYVGLHVRYRLFLAILIELEFSQHIFEKYCSAKFHENPSNESRVVPCGRMEGRMLIVVYYTSANVPNDELKVCGNEPSLRCAYCLGFCKGDGGKPRKLQ
jgi:hypothetical protein